MEKKEYQANQKNQKKLFKKYRKSMWKVVFGFILAVVATFVLPEYGLPALNTFLKGFLSSYIAGSITVFTQIGLTIAGLFTSLVNGIKANAIRTKLDEAQDLEEEYVDNVFNEIDELTKNNEKLKEKVNSLEKEIKLKKTDSKSDHLVEELNRELAKVKEEQIANQKKLVAELENELAKLNNGEAPNLMELIEKYRKELGDKEEEKHYRK